MGIKHSRPVPPFMRYCSAIIPTMFDDSLSYYEALCALNRFIQKNLVEVINNNATVTQEYIALVDELKEYVEHYFDNLDVQEEINNKLDELVADGTLETLIGNYFYRNVKYIFPKADETSSDSNLIIYDDADIKKTILIDANNSTAWAMLHDMLIKYQVLHLDYFILSHYDSDHIGNIQNLVTYGYIDADTTVLMPAQVTTYSQDYLNNISSTNAIFSNNNIPFTVPTEGQVIDIASDFKATFHNVDLAIVDGYTVKDSNSASSVVLFEHDGIKSFYTGDATTAVLDYLESINFPASNVNLYKITHHGINQHTNSKYINSLKPDYAVQCGSIKGFGKNEFGVCEETRILKSLGCDLYPTFMQPEFVELESRANSLNVNVGKPYAISGTYVEYTYYVDITADEDELQDGSQDHPFKELMQAISIIPTDKACNVTINVADGYYCNSHQAENNKNRLYVNTKANITINGNSSDRTKVVINGSAVYHSFITLNNLTIDCDNRDAIYSSDSVVNLNNVAITSYTETQSTTHSGIVLRSNSVLNILANTYITYVNEGISSTNSTINIPDNTLTIGSHNASIANINITNNAHIGAITFENSSDTATFNKYYVNEASPVDIMESHTANASTVTVKNAFSNYDWIEVFYHSTDNNYGSTGKIFSANGKKVRVISEHNGGTDNNYFYNKSAKFAFSGSTITISDSIQTTINMSNGNTGYSKNASNDYFNIDKVVAGNRYFK